MHCRKHDDVSDGSSACYQRCNANYGVFVTSFCLRMTSHVKRRECGSMPVELRQHANTHASGAQPLNFAANSGMKSSQ
jgi:hypothetical protein